MGHRVVITGLGWVTPMGHDVESVWRRLLAGESGIAPTTLFAAGTFPTKISAEVKGFDFAAVPGRRPGRPRRGRAEHAVRAGRLCPTRGG